MSSYYGAQFLGTTSEGSTTPSPAPIRFQRKASTGSAPPVPPPAVPPPESSGDEAEAPTPTTPRLDSSLQKQKTFGSVSSTSTTTVASVTPLAREPTRVSTLKREEKSKKLRQERMERERQELEEQRTSAAPQKESQEQHITLGERTSYVEEPISAQTTLERKAEKALVRRITNEMQLATTGAFMHPIAIHQKHPVGAYTPGVYRIRSLRFVEAALRRTLWALGKFLANRPIFAAILPILCFLSALSLPILSRNLIFVDMPFAHIFGAKSEIVTNGLGGLKAQEFNSTNPMFSCMNWRDPNHFAVLLRTSSLRDTILRKDAVLAYTALKKKLDHFPVEKREYLQQCSTECEIDKDMVDRIVKKSPQVALTYPETFVSMSKDSTNLTRVYLGATIGGVEIDTDGAISSATSLFMNFELKQELGGKEHDAWFRHFDDQILLTTAPNISIMSWSPENFRARVIETIELEYWQIPICAAILLGFCVVFSFGLNSYESKPCIGLMIFVTLVISSLTGFSMQFYRNLPIDPLIYPICVGILWLFQLHYSWSRYSSAAVHPTEKIAFILAHDAPGIVASAAVVVVTFLLMGLLMTNSHMVSSFIGIASSIAILVIFAILFISIFIFFGGRREARGVKWYQIFKTGDTQFTAPQLASFDSSALFGLHDRLIDTRPRATRAIGAFLIGRTVRYPIVFFCTAYLIFAAFGCSQTSVDIKEEYFLPQKSAEAAFIENYREQFGKTTRFLELVIDGSVEYHDRDVQNSIFEILDYAINEGFATRSANWLSEFTKFEKGSIYDVNPDTFVPVVNLVFLPSEPYRKFASDVVMDRFQTQIVKSRMFLELTPKGFNERVSLIETLLTKASSTHLPLSVSLPSTMSLRHDITVLSSGLYAFGIALVSLFIASLLLLGQPALTFLLLFTSIAVLVETIGYSYFWTVPINMVTLTMALAGNALTCVIVIAFCYSYLMSGKSQIRAGIRIQYTFQATLIPVLFACIIPVLTFIPILSVDVPLVYHIFKIIVLNATASLIHYLLFLPNLMLLFSEHFSFGCSSLNCAECCCDMDDESSIYYIPTGGRPIHPDGIYTQHAAYAYSVPKINAPPPHYLAIGAPPTPSANRVGEIYGQYAVRESSRRPRRHSESSQGGDVGATPRRDRDSRRRRHRRAVSRDSEIYEDLPSPRPATTSSRSNSPRHPHRPTYDSRQASRPQAYHYEEGAPQWRPYIQPSPYQMYYPGGGAAYGQTRR
ncbi:unnamed protein product [Caenorhabditis angaria]|uniref:SSD domain-containing protein n=1 Tax=Caenorhabditis angaria TaxID=860376 RepID=A0A9P1IFJ8_9PELO|nr:unnamed protein product [Caenorhabditis angaria]